MTALLARLDFCAANVAVVNIDNRFGAADLTRSILTVFHP
jgi:NCAIR mutase (PurE)-related protein